jgi:hypothetical protein
MKYVLALVAALSLGTAAAGDFKVGWMPSSKHFGAGKYHDYNEKHRGVILEVKVGEGWIGYMNYDNSLDNNSNTLYYQKDVWQVGNVAFGLVAGAVTGYSLDPAPYGAFTVTIPIGNFKPRLAILPIVAAPQYLWEF